MNVLVLSQYYWPEPIPKPQEIAEAARDNGHGVQVITGFPNYPSGRLYPGYPLRLWRRDSVGGLPVIRTFLYPSHGASVVGRMLNYSSFMLSSVVGGVLAAPFDVMYVWHPPLSIGVAAAAIAFLRNRPFVYDVLDIWPESAVATGFLRPGRLFDWFARVERFVYRRAAHIFVVTDGARASLIAKGVPEAKITIAPPWYDDTDLRQTKPGDREAVRAREAWGDRFVVMFAGNMGVLQGLDTLLHACRQLPAESRVLVALVGDGSDVPRLTQMVHDLRLEDRVRFVPRQPSSEMARYYAAADALFVHLRSSAIAEFTIPAKTIAYLAAGKPILLASTGAAAGTVLSAGAGIVLQPDDPDALAEALARISHLSAEERRQMGERGQTYFRARFTKEGGLRAYLAQLERAARAARS